VLSDLPVPKALLFDWDGTLVDTHLALASAMNVALETFGKEIWTYKQWQSWLGESARDAFPRVFGDDWERAKQIYLDAYEENHLEQLTLKDGASALLEELRNYPLFLAVVSNKTGSFLRAEVSHLEWDGFFDHLVGAGDSLHDKPAPDPAYAALKAGKHEPGPEVWFIGDNDVDVACGRAANCTTVLIGEGYPDAQPDHRIEHLTALKRLIQINLGRA